MLHISISSPTLLHNLIQIPAPQLGREQGQPPTRPALTAARLSLSRRQTRHGGHQKASESLPGRMNQESSAPQVTMKFCVLLIALVGCSWAFESCSSPTCNESCKNRCGKKRDKSFSCQCNDQCERFGDCCVDYNLCLYTEPSSESLYDQHSEPVGTPDKESCHGRCSGAYHKKDPCHCNNKCVKFNNCCKDYGTVCQGKETGKTHGQDPDKESCHGRCSGAYHKKDPCHCNNKCVKFNNCCKDYGTVCQGKETGKTHGQDPDTEPSSESSYDQHSEPVGTPDKESCHGRCSGAYHKKDPCHCNNKCVKFNNCCKDYGTVCQGKETGKTHGQDPGWADHSAGGDISQKEIEEVSESLYEADVNRAQEDDLVLKKQHLCDGSGGKQDRSDELLYAHVNEALLTKPTYAAFITLLDNYDRQTGICEEHSKEEDKEQDNFLQEIMKTDVMGKLYTFFHQKKRYSSQQEFVTDLKNMWFGLYSRGKGEQDSSGFEHVFVGEVKKGQVTGFHSWIRFYLLEKQGLVDYYSHNYDGPWTSFPDVVGKQFNWDGFVKEVGSSFIGSSPEFDFAMYSLCFIARPGKACKVSLGGHPLKIQTYTWTKSTYGKGKQYIATAYPVT